MYKPEHAVSAVFGASSSCLYFMFLQAKKKKKQLITEERVGTRPCLICFVWHDMQSQQKVTFNSCSKQGFKRLLLKVVLCITDEDL